MLLVIRDGRNGFIGPCQTPESGAPVHDPPRTRHRRTPSADARPSHRAKPRVRRGSPPQPAPRPRVDGRCVERRTASASRDPRPALDRGGLPPVCGPGLWFDRGTRRRARRDERRRPSASSPSATPGAVPAANRQGVAATDLTEMVAAATPSVVTITADGVSPRGFAGNQIPTSGVGSGVILTADGYILTNKHVVEGSQSLTVKLVDGTEVPATLVSESPDTDLALIKVGRHGPDAGDHRRLGRDRGRRDRRRDRQPAGHLHRDRDPRHRVRPRTDHHGPGRDDRSPGDADRPDPDRRGDQPRQQRRPAARCHGRRHRHQHRGLDERRRPRLRDPDRGCRRPDRRGAGADG